MKLSSLRTNERNPQTIKDENYKLLKYKILAYPNILNVRGLVYDSTDKNKVLGGNKRLSIFRELSRMSEAELVIEIESSKEYFTGNQDASFEIFKPLITTKSIPSDWLKDAKDWKEETKNAFVYIDNVNDGEWLQDIAKEDWSDEELLNFGVDFGGFDDLDEEKERIKNEDFHIKELTKDEIFVNEGDLIQFFAKGEERHRLLCGDSTSFENVNILMNGELSDMIFTDPDYSMEFDEVKECYKNAKEFSKKGFSFWVCADKQSVKLAMNDFDNFSHFFIHDFKIPTMKSGSQAMTAHNMICKFNNVKMNNLKDGFSTIISVATERTLKTHKLTPMSKRIELPFEFIQHYTSKDDLIVDLFIHSGSTIVAAHQLDRRCFGMELLPKYCQVSINRLLSTDPTLKVKINGKDYVKEEPVF